MTIQDVADLLGVGWDTVKSIFERYLFRRFSKPNPGKLKYIAIDEISAGKGQKYLTLVMDLDGGAVVFADESRSRETLIPLWKRLKRTRTRIEAVATDMNAGYIGAVTESLPDAAIVFDRFHAVKLMNEKIALIRRQLWSQPDRTTAERVLIDWIARAEALEIRPLQAMVRTLAAYRFGILAHYDYPISSGPIEGTNNKKKALKRQAYGYRDTESFKLRIMGVHEYQARFSRMNLKIGPRLARTYRIPMSGATDQEFFWRSHP